MTKLPPVSEFLEELYAFDPLWQKNYTSMLSASRAAGIEGIYRLWLLSPAGRRRSLVLEGGRDYVGEQQAHTAAYERLMADIERQGYDPTGDEDTSAPEGSYEDRDEEDGFIPQFLE